MTPVQNLIVLARKNLGGAMESSARLCLADAIVADDDGQYDVAAQRALKSLAYSVGIGSPDYVRGTALWRKEARTLTKR